MMGFLTCFLASASQRSTSGKSGLPERAPPPRCASGDMRLPKSPSQSISSGNDPHGSALVTWRASQAGCSAIAAARRGGTKRLSLSASGMRSVPATESMSPASSASLLPLSPTLGQERLSWSPKGLLNSAMRAESKFLKATSSRCRFCGVSVTGMKEIQNGSLRSCQLPLVRSVCVPGPESPTAFNVTPCLGFAIIHLGHHSCGVILSLCSGIFPARAKRVVVFAAKVVLLQSIPRCFQRRWKA